VLSFVPLSGWGLLQRSCVCAPCNPFFFFAKCCLMTLSASMPWSNASSTDQLLLWKQPKHVLSQKHAQSQHVMLHIPLTEIHQ
jgi:hypothetical protein